MSHGARGCPCCPSSNDQQTIQNKLKRQKKQPMPRGTTQGRAFKRRIKNHLTDEHETFPPCYISYGCSSKSPPRPDYHDGAYLACMAKTSPLGTSKTQRNSEGLLTNNLFTRAHRSPFYLKITDVEFPGGWAKTLVRAAKSFNLLIFVEFFVYLFVKNMASMVVCKCTDRKDGRSCLKKRMVQVLCSTGGGHGTKKNERGWGSSSRRRRMGVCVYRVSCVTDSKVW
jgi:hypothetical protein